MTAEIVVANKWGIAIAADSAVTSTRVHKGALREKVSQAANKLFALSKWEPVSAMIYNSVTIGGTPWETIIKLARRELGRQRFPHLDQYGSFFWDFIKNNPHVTPEEDSKHIAFINMLRLLQPMEDGDPPLDEFRARIEKRVAQLEKVERIQGFDEVIEASIEGYYSHEIDGVVRLLDEKLKDGTRSLIVRLIQLAFTRKELLRGYSGIVISGFGVDEVMPRIIDYSSDIMVCGKPRFWQNQDLKVTSKIGGSLVLPFADTEVIETLLNGINPRYEKRQNDAALRTIIGITNTVIDQISELNDDKKEEYKSAANESIIDAFIGFAQSMDAYRLEELRKPIESTLETLAVSDLAVVAETLLNTSQIHKRVNPETETVGGPVDVAVLTKGDGFVWIKRKHYFNRELNPGFIGKYLDN